MEEVWKDISLSSFSLQQGIPSTPFLSQNHQPHQLRSLGGASPTTTSFSSKGIILQDFLTGGFKETNSHDPSTPLSLNSGQLLGHLDSKLSGGNDGVSSPSAFSNGVSADGGLVACYLKKHALEQRPNENFGSGNDDVDRRKKRMIKNRESAARSRARKQAYTNELEQEVDHLLNENRMLKRQYEELKKAMAHQLPTATKRSLHRTLTAPF